MTNPEPHPLFLETPAPASREQLFAFLDALGVAHQTHAHAPVFTVEESQEIKAHLPGAHTKNLFLKSKKGELVLVCACGDTPVRLNHLHKPLGTARFSFGSPELLLETLGVPAGSVTLFSLLNEKTGAVPLVLDKVLAESDPVNFHPLLNDATTTISGADMFAFARACGREPIVIDFTALAAQSST